MVPQFGAHRQAALEYCVQFWSPCSKKDRLERVRSRAMKGIRVLENLPHEDRLKKRGLLILEKTLRGVPYSASVLED